MPQGKPASVWFLFYWIKAEKCTHISWTTKVKLRICPALYSDSCGAQRGELRSLFSSSAPFLARNVKIKDKKELTWLSWASRSKLCWRSWKCIKSWCHLDICRLSYPWLAQELPSTRARATHFPVMVEGTYAMCCLLLVSPGFPLCSQGWGWYSWLWRVEGSKWATDITWLWFWKTGAVPGCECSELESWQARMERTFLSPPTAALSFPFKLKWPQWLDTDTLTPATCRSYGVWLDVPVNRICSVKCVNRPWAHGKCTRDLPVLCFSSRCLAQASSLKSTEILLTS